LIPWFSQKHTHATIKSDVESDVEDTNQSRKAY